MRLDDGVFLKVDSLLSFPGQAPDPASLEQAERALEELLKTISASRIDAPPERDSNENSPTTAGEDYRNESILPFTFEYPTGWYVCHDSAQSPGSLWVLATPFEEDAQISPLDGLPAALRITVIGFARELLGADDELSRAVDLIISSRAAEGAAVNPLGEALLGQAKGRLITYAFPDDSDRLDGILLVAAAEASVLVADFSWAKTLRGRFEPRALEILNTFKLEPKRAQASRSGARGPSFEYPESWSLEGVRTEDDSKAFVLRSADELEFVMRSLVPAELLPMNQVALRDTATAFLVDEMGLVTAAAMDAAPPIAIPGSEAGLYLFVSGPDRSTDVYGFMRGGGIHFCFLDLPKGLQNRSYGLALETMLTLRGPREVSNRPALEHNPQTGRLMRSVVFRHASLDPFDAAGNYVGMDSGQLRLDRDGSYRYTWFESGKPGRDRGQYRISDTELELKPVGDSPPATFGVDVARRRLTSRVDRRIWLACPDLP